MRVPRQQELTGIQNQIINIVTNTDIKRMAIVGGPGTGKTVLEVIIANKLATEGILCLTYYNLLTNSTSDTLNEIRRKQSFPSLSKHRSRKKIQRYLLGCRHSGV